LALPLITGAVASPLNVSRARPLLMQLANQDS
jgi:hypothetical protein